MKRLIAAIATIMLALPASADPRLGTKACVVEHATAFVPSTGNSGLWNEAQKSFILNVYTCEEVRARNLDMGWESTCDQASPDMLAIKSTLDDFKSGWEHTTGHVTLIEGNRQLIVAEFRSSCMYADEYNRPILRLYPNLDFEFVRLSKSTASSTITAFFLIGTCADFQ